MFFVIDYIYFYFHYFLHRIRWRIILDNMNIYKKKQKNKSYVNVNLTNLCHLLSEFITHLTVCWKPVRVRENFLKNYEWKVSIFLLT